METWFQSTHPHGVRLYFLLHTLQTLLVSIHAPTRGATCNGAITGIFRCVSIHAPTRGATLQCACAFRFGFVSIHAPTRGATRFSLSGYVCTRLFQSTHPHGVRLHGSNTFKASLCFNPRTHTGCDSVIGVANPQSVGFQSTHPHGVRLCVIIKFTCYYCFNPRTHTGCDSTKQRPGFAGFVSIHAPTRGATLYFQPRHVLTPVSIHAPTRGATRSFQCNTKIHCRFNPRTHTGCDCTLDTNAEQLRLVSIHAPTRGATFPDNVVRFRGVNVSIHAPTRGATTATRILWQTRLCFNPRTHTGCDPPVLFY